MAGKGGELSEAVAALEGMRDPYRDDVPLPQGYGEHTFGPVEEAALEGMRDPYYKGGRDLEIQNMILPFARHGVTGDIRFPAAPLMATELVDLPKDLGGMMKGHKPIDPLRILEGAAEFSSPGVVMNMLRGATGRGTRQAILGANAYHGSPHRWAPEPNRPHGRPRLDKIGSGEGAQVYGHGFYAAQTPDVAKQYQRNLTNDFWQTPDGELFDPSTLEHLNARSVIRRNPDIDSALPKLRAIASRQRGSDAGDMMARDISKLEALKKKGGLSAPPGTLYKIDIPDDDVAKFLDWDAPLSQQPEALAVIKKHWDDTLGDPDIVMQRLNITENSTGQDLYNALGGLAQNYENASEYFKKLGIPGLKYYDGMSRNIGDVVMETPTTHGTLFRNSAGTHERYVGDVIKSHRGDIDAARSEIAAQLAKHPEDATIKKALELVQNPNNKFTYHGPENATRNYVTWDQNVLNRTKILERNGERLTGNTMPDLPMDEASRMIMNKYGDEVPVKNTIYGEVFGNLPEQGYLHPAIYHDGKIYTGVDHQNALASMPKDMPDDIFGRIRTDADNRVFVNSKGKILNRWEAQKYAQKRGLINDSAPEWAHSSPELIAENLRLYPSEKFAAGGYPVGGMLTGNTMEDTVDDVDEPPKTRREERRSRWNERFREIRRRQAEAREIRRSTAAGEL